MFSFNPPSCTPTTSTIVQQLYKGVRGNGSIESIHVILKVFVFLSFFIFESTLGIQGGFWDIGVGNWESFENVGTRSKPFLIVLMKCLYCFCNSSILEFSIVFPVDLAFFICKFSAWSIFVILYYLSYHWLHILLFSSSPLFLFLFSALVHVWHIIMRKLTHKRL